MRRAWNIVNIPVYSLAGYVEDKINMNICTYVTPVSMKPKQYMIALDPKTATYEAMLQSDIAVLQLLSKHQIELVRTLGKKSAKNYDKEAYLRKKKLLTEWESYSVLDQSAAFIKLKKKERIDLNGDHELFFFDVMKSKTNFEDNILMFQDLIEAGIIL